MDNEQRAAAASNVPVASANTTNERAAAASNVPFVSADTTNERAAAAGNVPFASANATNERAAAASNVPSVIHTPLNDRAAAFLNIHTAKNTLLNCNVARFDWQPRAQINCVAAWPNNNIETISDNVVYNGSTTNAVPLTLLDCNVARFDWQPRVKINCVAAWPYAMEHTGKFLSKQNIHNSSMTINLNLNYGKNDSGCTTEESPFELDTTDINFKANSIIKNTTTRKNVHLLTFWPTISDNWANAYNTRARVRMHNCWLPYDADVSIGTTNSARYVIIYLPHASNLNQCDGVLFANSDTAIMYLQRYTTM